ncbi:hypothetical protein M2168_000465 [Streptomyces sp. CZ24]|nr:hypothetical protein [Streptomyces sp. CZ24]
MAGAQFQGGAQALVAEAGRHADVGEDDVGPVLLDGAGQGGRVAHGGHHLVAAPVEEFDEAGPEQDGVLGEDYTEHGTSTRS